MNRTGILNRKSKQFLFNVCHDRGFEFSRVFWGKIDPAKQHLPGYLQMLFRETLQESYEKHPPMSGKRELRSVFHQT